MVTTNQILTYGLVGVAGALMIKKASRRGSYLDVNFIERTALTHNVDHYKFAFKSNNTPKTIPILSKVHLKTPDNQKGEYTPIFNDDEGYIHFMIKNYHRTASGALAQLQPGAEGIRITKPHKHFKEEVPLDKFKQVYLIGAGVGLAPLWGYMNACLEKPESPTKIKLIYANHSKDDIIFKKELDDLKTKYSDRLEVVHVLKTQVDGKESDFTKYVGSRLNNEMLKNELSTGAGDDDVKVFVCGPKKFVSMVCGSPWWYGGALKELGFKKGQLYMFH
ncbi:unnamed protein product [Ambrosiozyma monospora]|uniref:Unnamed protein product n=1 Tax=Ambrosiozyma monospora TaxID=43982 RepID=A0ACB5TL70_AMBMO|nr:unnamed protein product [Ambrosiozyma monospora]